MFDGDSLGGLPLHWSWLSLNAGEREGSRSGGARLNCRTLAATWGCQTLLSAFSSRTARTFPPAITVSRSFGQLLPQSNASLKFVAARP